MLDPSGLPLESLWDEEWRRNLIHTAMERVRQEVNPKQFQVFHLLTVKQMSAEEVVILLNLKVANIYLIKHRVAALIKKEITRLEGQTK